ncbi:hypothetical protein MTsPCn9_34020 [Croceitalea sp. MTPC9]|jgi:hypothetical protein|uniref:hypothetical protein n=1 Tax=unclassified Croceitalea TaxID=2632280 RepID=UPI00257B271B|nr:hypothetical protein [Allomuricauda sp.]GMN12161.1 hypothetical protein MTsPCn6_34930 [Croceitalea sp. MTPC6]GMN18462.1 hypothetical protein MTsPCn9_34020 [Croceitalea sp. MTPC9]|tara:strand:- start:6006 stop:6293 length:288 start_codon:yes stop_codon:yes gene_type:complete
MKFREAKNVVNSHAYLLGKTVNGMKIDELFIYPLDEASYSVFIAMYCISLNNEEALKPFIEEEMGIKCILNKSSIDMGNKIHSLTINEVKDLIKE